MWSFFFAIHNVVILSNISTKNDLSGSQGGDKYVLII
jgi:hypothetical protein